MPPPLLEMPHALYSRLMADLARSGQGKREAGAFLLGPGGAGTRQVTSYLMYDVVAPKSSRRHAYVAFTAQEMARAWDHCYAQGYQVVADIHTHPRGPAQSATDRAHPIVCVPGHVALIAPFYAMRNPQPIDLGVHVFEGKGQWRSLFRQAAKDVILFT